ncbi:MULTISPECIES: SRPBCC family protein [Microbacterium]|uniref:SRPBCC family protein n=1 Tax=Microbacterium TaxID=33882 RepID=UPI001E628FE8|nr:SRPBCC family protein [Microbacterium nymphoidis]MCD2499132.1 SRPBCC family protein [Microbacterium nymphoidis]
MTTQVSASTVVDVPIDEVYDQWTQFEDFPRFMSSVKRVEQIDDVRTHWDVEVGGVERSFYATITQQEPDRLVRWESEGDKMHSGEVSFMATGEGTKVSLSMEWEPEGFVESAGALLNLDDRAAEKDLERFKAFIEQRGQATGAWRGRVQDL